MFSHIITYPNKRITCEYADIVKPLSIDFGDIVRRVISSGIEVDESKYRGYYTITPIGEYLDRCAPLTRVIDPNFELLQVIEFEAEYEEGVFYLSDPSSGIYGSGITLTEARRDCEAMLISLYRRYVEDDGPKSEAATAFGERLKLFVRRRGNNE